MTGTANRLIFSLNNSPVVFTSHIRPQFSGLPARKDELMLISKKMVTNASGASMVRKMFEEGRVMKQQYGDDNVFDFSIGNPDVPPPPVFTETLIKLLQKDAPGMHGYMPNSGWPQVREKVADFLNEEQGAGLANKFTANHILMTSGAGGALNVTFKTICDEGDEFITPKPYFMEYGFYVDNHGGKLVPADSGSGFKLDIKAIEAKLSPNTRAVLINSPHNPTGVIYDAQELTALGELLTKAGERNGRPIMLVSDEPYRKLAYGGVKVPSVFAAYPYSVVCTSYSKDLSLAGERIGYIAINPDMPENAQLFEAMTVANRILGFTNANSLMQLAVGELQGLSVDINLYEERRDVFVKGLLDIGYELAVPRGAFYLFPKTPIEDDMAFVNMLKEEKVLTVPGRSFGQPGYFRICYCVPMKTIQNSLKGFASAFARAKG